MQHLDEGTVHAWLDGALAPEEARRAEEHARDCARCAALVADARGLVAGASRIVAALDGGQRGVRPQRPAGPAATSLWRSLRLTPARAGLAAAVLVAVATMLTLRGAGRDADTSRRTRPDSGRTVPRLVAAESLAPGQAIRVPAVQRARVRAGSAPAPAVA